MQAYVKARGDGLGFDLGRAEFDIGLEQAGLQAATVSVAGQTLTRYCVTRGQQLLNSDLCYVGFCTVQQPQ